MSTAAPEKRKRCLYEVLGVSRDCSSEEIRSAYRRLALQLHPDKVSAQPGGATTPEEATAAFQELVHAYEVLSDPKERAYYDSHRTQILFSDPNSSSSWKPFNVDVFAYFSSSAYSGYGDTGRGFFKVYGDVFKRVYEQELWFSKELGLAPDAVPPAPLLGNMESPYSQVTAFYNYWLGFCTVMDFGWLDMYDSSAGPNRKSRRVMEEENKKLRKKAKREYNDSIRGLAAFAKKRDKRVIDMVMKKKAEEDKRREEEKERKKEEERKKLEQLRLYREQEWAKINEEDEEELMKDDGYVDVEGDNKNSRRKGGGSNKELFCVVCSKKFKSEKQWKNHEQSKKHRDKVAELRESFLEEEEEISEGEDSAGDQLEDQFTSFDYVPEADDDDNVVDELCKELDDGFGLHEDIDNAVVTTVSDQESDGETSILEAMVSGHQNVKGRNATQNDISPTEKIHKFADSEEEGSMEYDNRKKGRRNRAKRRANKGKYDEVIMKKETTEGLPNENELHNGEDNAKNTSSSSNLVDVESNAGNHVSGKNQKAKKQQIEVKDIGRKDRDPVPKSSAKGKTNKGASKSQSNACGTCGESFESRNKLFMHLGETGHAMLKLR